MKSRIAVTAVLALGMLMMATSAGLAVSGVAGGGSAGKAQYLNKEVAPGGSGGGPSDDGGTLGEGGGSVSDETPNAQAPRQASAGSADELPFTGFAALLLLVGGIAVLVTGLVMRRRSGPGQPG